MDEGKKKRVPSRPRPTWRERRSTSTSDRKRVWSEEERHRQKLKRFVDLVHLMMNQRRK